MICQPMADPNTGGPKWELFTTRGIPVKAQEYVAFFSYYLLNQIHRSVPYAQTSVLSGARTSEMIRATRISINLDIAVQPKSGFRIQLFVVQSPHSLEQMMPEVPRDIPDNTAFPPNSALPHGCFMPNGQLFTDINQHLDGEGKPVEPESYAVAIKKYYEDIFGPQVNPMEHQTYHQFIHGLKIRAPMTTVLFNKHLTYVNRRKTARSFRYNKLLPLSTTWKYPPISEQGRLAPLDEYDATPDRKVYFFMFLTPMTGPPEDPKENMFGFNVAGDVDETSMSLRDYRATSVVSDIYDPPAPEDAGGARAGPSVRTRSKSKGKSVKKETKTPTPAPSATAVEKLKLMEYTDEAQQNAFLNALALHKAKAQDERDKRKEEVAADALTSHSWSVAQTVMIRPTIRIWWKNLRYRQYVKTYRRR